MSERDAFAELRQLRIAVEDLGREVQLQGRLLQRVCDTLDRSDLDFERVSFAPPSAAEP